MQGKRIIILDRDGVINHDSDDFIKSPEEWQALPGSLEAISRLCKAEYRVFIVSNQSGVARGLLTLNTLNRIHQKMLDQLHALGGEIEGILFCPHGPDDGCQCRKPLTGLYVDLQQRLKSSLHNVDAIGDAMRDLQAAAAISARPVLVRTGKGKKTEQQLANGEGGMALSDVPIFDDLAAYVESLRASGALEMAR